MLSKDPKTSQWLWDERERNRQKERTEHYRQIMRLQQKAADPLTDIAMEDDSQVREGRPVKGVYIVLNYPKYVPILLLILIPLPHLFLLLESRRRRSCLR